MRCWAVLVLTIFELNMYHSLINTNITSVFLQTHSIHRAVFFHCLNRSAEEVKLLRSKGPKMVLTWNLNTKVNIINLLTNGYGRMGVLLDGNCQKAKILTQEAGRHNFFNLKYYWMVFSNFNPENWFENVSTSVDSNIYVAHQDRGTNYIIYESYNPASTKGGLLLTKKLGYFNNLSEYSMKKIDDGKFWRRRNLTGVTFNTPIVLHEPYTTPVEDYLKNNRDREVNTYNRYQNRLMKFCKQQYNFSINMTVLNKFGYKKKDGTMDGLVGELQRHTADFGLSPLFVHEDRVGVMTYGRHTYSLTSAFVFITPRSKSNFYIFLQPLSSSVWYCALVVCIISLLITKAICNWHLSEIDDLTWSHFVIGIFSIISQQGSPIIPSTTSGRTAIFFIIVFTSVVYNFYSGSLVSSLLSIHLKPINTVEDILKYNMSIGIENNTLNKEYFQYTKSKTAINLYQNLIKRHEDEIYLNVSYGLEKLRNGRYAFHVELAKAYRFIRNRLNDQSCQIGTVLLYKPLECYASYVKHSPFKDIMDVCLHKLAESGVMKKEFLFWHGKKEECRPTHTISTGIEELYSLLVCLLAGAITSILVLSLEVLKKKLKQY